VRKCENIEFWKGVVGVGKAGRRRKEVALSSGKLRKFEKTHRKTRLSKTGFFDFPSNLRLRDIEPHALPLSRIIMEIFRNLGSENG
jgi:hypothetical protein